jgi:hypothetical protein
MTSATHDAAPRGSPGWLDGDSRPPGPDGTQAVEKIEGVPPLTRAPVAYAHAIPRDLPQVQRSHPCPYPRATPYLAFLEKRRNFGRQGNYLLSYKYLWALSENEGILLANSETLKCHLTYRLFEGTQALKQPL